MGIFPDDYYDAARWALTKPSGAHVLTTSLLGKTAEHLAAEHPREPTDGSQVDNLRAHFRAHRALQPR